jgi:hypothetical protein
VISDGAARLVVLARPPADGFTISDAAALGHTLRGTDAWSVADSGALTRGYLRLSSDAWAVTEMLRLLRAQLVDLPERLVLTPEADSLVLGLAGGLALNPGILTLQLELDARSLALNSEARTLALKDDGERVGVDG